MIERTVKLTDDRVIDFLDKNFKSVNRGAQECTLYYSYIRNATLWSLKGKFTDSELFYLLDALRDYTIRESDARLNTVKSTIVEGFTSQKYQVNPNDLIRKVESLNNYQSFILIEFLVTYWQLKKVEKDLYIKVLEPIKDK